MYDSLSRLQGSLDAVQNNILEALRNGTNSQLRQTISSALGYEERNHSPLPLSDFNNAAAYLHTFATVTARHSPELNTDYPSFDLQNDANQLSTGIASNVDFLDQLPVKRGWTGGSALRDRGRRPSAGQHRRLRARVAGLRTADAGELPIRQRRLPSLAQ